MNRGLGIVVSVLVAAGTVVDGRAILKRRVAESEFQVQVELARAEADRIRAEVVLPRAKSMPRGENFAGALQQFGLTASEVNDATAAAQRAFNLRRLRAGNSITVGRSVEGTLREINYKIDADRMLHIVSQAQGFSAEVKEILTHLEVAVVSGRLEDSLFNAVEDAGESAEVAMRMAQIFGYDLDFYTDPRRGDTFRLVLERKKYERGETAGYGRILAAEYVNGGRKYQALLFHDPSGRAAYYAADGKSLQKAFLRSPLKFGAPVTSHFSKARFHPILKTVRAHLGTDYGAPTGTPVQTIGSGRVMFAGRKGGDGNMVHVAHSNGYETYYLHLSRIYVRAGERVEIGKTIGLVGMTGLATGPHLDFRILEKGQFRNFETLGLPPSDPVSKRDWTEFAAVRERWLPVMEQGGQIQVQTQASGGAATR
ncbi:MAG TPA: peptidoglycan DD-metalloendopeptidase family protein [Candidatus Limnocylindrales bacterium]|nr:peptidoglycan DD-metalloendopeptidase family protein [Candidatus Limnocylindrales bacterium]